MAALARLGARAARAASRSRSWGKRVDRIIASASCKMSAFWSSLKCAALATASGAVSRTRLISTAAPVSRAPAATASGQFLDMAVGGIIQNQHFAHDDLRMRGLRGKSSRIRRNARSDAILPHLGVHGRTLGVDACAWSCGRQLLHVVILRSRNSRMSGTISSALSSSAK